MLVVRRRPMAQASRAPATVPPIAPTLLLLCFLKEMLASVEDVVFQLVAKNSFLHAQLVDGEDDGHGAPSRARSCRRHKMHAIILQ